MEIMGDAVAEVVLQRFAQLPAKRKPQWRGNGVREWVPLSAIVVQDESKLRCVALGTGMKCLPQSKISQAKGVVLHDWHAEVVTIRAFNRFLLDELKILETSGQDCSRYVRRRPESEITDEHFQPFAVVDGIKFHMYCSEAPCGDASMELTMAAQDDDTPWDLPSQIVEHTDREGALNGRGYFSQLGVVRRKPSRPDAPATLSKSCSDKMSVHQCTSLLSSVVSLLVSPENCYIDSLTLPFSQYSVTGYTRAFSDEGRMAPFKNQRWDGGYSFRPFQIRTTTKEFEFSRRLTREDNIKIVPSNLAAAWTDHVEETLIGGVLQGRKRFDPQGASMLCRKNIWAFARDVAFTDRWNLIGNPLTANSYAELKASTILKGRRNVKQQVFGKLRGWVRNQEDEFTLL